MCCPGVTCACGLECAVPMNFLAQRHSRIDCHVIMVIMIIITIITKQQQQQQQQH